MDAIKEDIEVAKASEKDVSSRASWKTLMHCADLQETTTLPQKAGCPWLYTYLLGLL